MGCKHIHLYIGVFVHLFRHIARVRHVDTKKKPATPQQPCGALTPAPQTEFDECGWCTKTNGSSCHPCSGDARNDGLHGEPHVCSVPRVRASRRHGIHVCKRVSRYIYQGKRLAGSAASRPKQKISVCALLRRDQPQRVHYHGMGSAVHRHRPRRGSRLHHSRQLENEGHGNTHQPPIPTTIAEFDARAC